MNPYTILNIDQQASQKEIIKAAALAMRKREYAGQEIAVAQRELLDPVTRAVHTFIQFPEISRQGPPPVFQPSMSQPAGDALRRLPIFDKKP